MVLLSVEEASRRRREAFLTVEEGLAVAGEIVLTVESGYSGLRGGSLLREEDDPRNSGPFL